MNFKMSKDWNWFQVAYKHKLSFCDIKITFFSWLYGFAIQSIFCAEISLRSKISYLPTLLRAACSVLCAMQFQKFWCVHFKWTKIGFLCRVLKNGCSEKRLFAAKKKYVDLIQYTFVVLKIFVAEWYVLPPKQAILHPTKTVVLWP